MTLEELTRNEVRNYVQRKIADERKMDPSEIAEDKSLAQLGVDSLTGIDLFISIEEFFEDRRQFSSTSPLGEDNYLSLTVGQIIDYVYNLPRNNNS